MKRYLIAYFRLLRILSKNPFAVFISTCHQTPALTTNSFTNSAGPMVDASIYGLNTGGPTGPWQTLNTQVGCRAGGVATTTFANPFGGPPATVTWTDLTGGDVLISVF